MGRLRWGANMSSIKGGYGPLDWAVSRDCAERLVLFLLAAGADPDDGLHGAVFTGKAETLQLLLAAGGDPNYAGNNSYNPPLICAAATESSAVLARVLLAAGADPNSKDVEGDTPLHWAASRGRTDMARQLLDAGADLGAASNKDGDPPLHCAVSAGDCDTVALLLRRGANINIKDQNGRTALDVARRGGNNQGLIDAARRGPRKRIVDLLATSLTGLTVGAD